MVGELVCIINNCAKVNANRFGINIFVPINYLLFYSIINSIIYLIGIRYSTVVIHFFFQ